MWKNQHEPTLLENGNMLLFDNEGNNGRSKVIEFDPLTQEIIWAYRGNSTNNFFSLMCGANQRLPNGNTLITESNKGRAFEVTQNKRIIWEFINPHRTGDNKELIAVVFEIIRTDPGRISFLSGPSRK